MYKIFANKFKRIENTIRVIIFINVFLKQSIKAFKKMFGNLKVK